MCLQVLAEIFGNAIGIMIFSFLGFITLIYLIGIIISLFIGIVVWLVLNPLTGIFLIVALLLGGFLLLTK